MHRRRSPCRTRRLLDIDALERRELLAAVHPPQSSDSHVRTEAGFADVGPVSSGGAPAHSVVELGRHIASRAARTVPSRSFLNVPYWNGPGGPQALDIHLPAGVAPAGGWPVVVAIHGGGWRRFDKAEYAAKVAPELNRAGFAVVAPDYTLSAPGAPSWPWNYRELRGAVSWVRDHAGDYGFDPSRIAAMGESAGGHLAALLGTRADNQGVMPAADPSRVEAVVDFFGPTDLARLYRESTGGGFAAAQLLGTTPDAAPALYAAASAVSYVGPGAASTIIFQGTADSLVPSSQSTELASALTAAGVPTELNLIPGASHGFGLRVGSRSLVPEIAAFLQAHMPH